VAFFPGFDVKKNQEKYRQYSQNGTVDKIIHKEWFTHFEVSVLVESKVLKIGKIGLLIKKLIKSHGVLQR
jgi:hypothetical protein